MGGVNLALSTPSGAESKEVVSADYIGNKISTIETTLDTCYKKTVDDNATLSGIGMPSSRYINLTLGASGSTYTAPANGWVYIGGACSGYVSLYLSPKGLTSMASPTSVYGYGRVYIPVGKGDTFGVDYVGLTVDGFQFFYAEGET